LRADRWCAASSVEDSFMNKRSTHLLRATLFAVGAFVVTAGCATSRAPAAQADDAALAMRVGARLTADPDVRRYEIDVDVLNEVVTLRGIVGTEEERTEAENIAARTPGVERVRNLIELESEVPESDKSDFAMRVKIGSQLAADPDVRRTDIDVDVEEGKVTLSGVVANNTAREEAERIARSVEGVREVNNELKVAQFD
jgi:hyperosmotically inducible protein